LWGQLLICHPEGHSKLHPWPPGGEFCPLGGCSHLYSPPRVHTIYCLGEWRDEQRISPPRITSPLRDKNSPLGDNFAPWVRVCPSCKVETRPQGWTLSPRGEVIPNWWTLKLFSGDEIIFRRWNYFQAVKLFSGD
jgi:hypothetical protein